MFSNGAFFEAKRVALALNTLIKTRFPRDYLELVVFSYFAMELQPERLLQSDWVDWSGTNIELALAKSPRAPEQAQVVQPPDHPDHGLAAAAHLGSLRRRGHHRGHAAARSSAAPAAASASTPS